MLKVRKISLADLLLLLVLIRSAPAVAIVELPIAQAKRMKHTVPCEPVSHVRVWAFKSLVWTILQESSIDVFGYLAFTDHHNLILRFCIRGCEVTFIIEWNEWQRIAIFVFPRFTQWSTISQLSLDAPHNWLNYDGKRELLEWPD